MKEVKKLVDKLRHFKGVNSIFLFGSYATGKQLPFSDMDICVIGKLSEREKGEIESLSYGKIQIVFFDELPVYIKFNVLKEGKQLFCRDTRYLHETAFRTLKEYLDFQPLLRRFERFYSVSV